MRWGYYERAVGSVGESERRTRTLSQVINVSLSRPDDVLQHRMCVLVCALPDAVTWTQRHRILRYRVTALVCMLVQSLSGTK